LILISAQEFAFLLFLQYSMVDDDVHFTYGIGIKLLILTELVALFKKTHPLENSLEVMLERSVVNSPNESKHSSTQ